MRLRALYWRLGAAAFVPLAIVLGIYFFVFAPGHWFELSRDPEDWERFGAYVGGILGPIYALLAIGGVLITIAVQREQTTVDQLAGLLSRVADSIDAILVGQPTLIPPDVFEQAQNRGIRSFVIRSILAATAGTALSPRSRDEKVRTHNDNLQVGLLQVLLPETGFLTTELENLVRCLKEYAKVAGEGAPLIHLYKSQYRFTVTWLCALDALESPEVEQYFDAKAHAAVVREGIASGRYRV